MNNTESEEIHHANESLEIIKNCMCFHGTLGGNPQLIMVVPSPQSMG